jgi:tetratricopeptide (TPR) repeat protein
MLAWGMIVKGSDDELSHVKRALKSVLPHIDTAFITVTYKKGDKPSYKMLQWLDKQPRVVVSEYEWEGERFHFGKARQFNYEQIPDTFSHWGWMDADDTLENGHKIADIIKGWGNLDGVNLKYEYDHDEQGNPIDTLYLPRLLKHNGVMIWDGKPIHEIITDTRQSHQARNEEVWFKHHAEEGRRDKSLKRNIEALEAMLEDENEEPDPRTLFYLGGSYYDAGEHDKAIFMYEKYLEFSGWDLERQAARINLGRIHRTAGNIPKAKEAFSLAIQEDPRFPEAYVEMGKTESAEGNHEKAIHWLEMAVIQKPRPTSHSTNPLYYTYIPYVHLAQTHLNRGGDSLKIAHKWAEKAYEVSKDEGTKGIVDATEHMYKERELLIKAVDEIKEAGDDGDRVLAIIDKLPESLQDNPLILSFKYKFVEPTKWEKSVVIYTGDSRVGEWGPWSLEEGIGGSEEAVVRVSRQLVKQGWDVTIYGSPGMHADTYEGVVWKNHWEINWKDEFDVFVAWRSPWTFDTDIKARKKYLWLHDVMEEGDFTKDRTDKMDKIMVLSKYHRTCFPKVPDDKFFFTGNAIDPEDFDATPKRIPGKIVYTSSHVRGLKNLYEIWGDVKKAVPHATLDVFYGWHSYDKINQNNPERLQWKTDMVELANSLDGVTDHGKVAQSRIATEMLTSDVWAYPTLFPEIYCITAVKAQAAGAYPVVSKTAALAEMVQFGDTMDIKEWNKKEKEEYTKLLIDALKNENKDRTPMQEWAKQISWEKLSKEWTDEFNG